SWYELNFHLAWQHAELSANDTLAGTQGPFLTHLERWIRRLIGALFQAPFGIALGAVLLAGVGAALLRRRRGSREPGSRFPLTMLAGTFVTVPVLLVLLAGQVNTDPRYVSPAIPAVGLALVALLRLLDIRLVTALVVLVLGAQFANVTLQNLYSGTPSALV